MVADDPDDEGEAIDQNMELSEAAAERLWPILEAELARLPYEAQCMTLSHLCWNWAERQDDMKEARGFLASFMGSAPIEKWTEESQ